MLVTKLGEAKSSRESARFGAHKTAPDIKVVVLIRRLCEMLNVRRVNYVHWKSNNNIGRALSGVDDLDLLVDRRDSQLFLALVHEMGFRETVEHPSRRIPGIHHFYGFDDASGQLVHIHAHFQLVLGHDATKNYHLPTERAYLAAAQRDRLLPVADPSFELIIYVLRMVLKFTLYKNPLAKFDRTGQYDELEYLENLADQNQVDQIIRKQLPYLDPTLFAICLDAVRPGMSMLVRWKARRQLHVALRPYARRTRAHDVWLKFKRTFFSAIVRGLRIKKRGKKLARGGIIIAIVGGDGAGKTTVIEQIVRHFATFVSVRSIHLGKPKRTLRTRVVRMLCMVDLAVRKYVFRRGSQRDSEGKSQSQLLRALRFVSKARDGYLAYARACRFATGGGLVICDRWPVAGLRLMEAPQLAERAAMPGSSALVKALARIEGEYYSKTPAPDKVLVLRVPPEVAVARKPSEPAEWLRRRSQEVWDFDWQKVGAQVVDANKPLDEVVSEVISATWQAI